MIRLPVVIVPLQLLGCIGTVDATKIIRATPVDQMNQRYESCRFGVLRTATGKVVYEFARPTDDGKKLEAILPTRGGWRSIELRIRCEGSDTIKSARVGWWRGGTVDLGRVVLPGTPEAATSP